MSAPEKFENVTALTQANVYFGGKVVSHAIFFADGSKKTLGLIFAGRYEFDTNLAERMEITAGSCRVLLPGSSDWQTVEAGSFFEVPAKSLFQIEVLEGTAQYVCSYLA